MDEKSQLLSAEEARHFLGVSRTTMHRLLSAGELKGLKAGGQWRFRREDLTAYMERRPAGLAVGAISLLDDEAKFWEQLMSNAGLTLEAGRSATADEKIAAIADGIIDLAATEGVSDIHFDPGRETSKVRFRGEGALREIRQMPTPLFEGLIAYLKGATGMDVDEKTLPQDGRIRRDVADTWLDVRATTLPTLAGEALTLRLHREAAVPRLEMFSSQPEELAPLRDFLKHPNGLILVSGPTGSGKTSTLHALLQEAVRPEIKIVTIEDPVEIRFPEVQQCNLNRRMGQNYAYFVRAVLRTDPDLIFCMEVNEAETADAVVNAAFTGHLVFGTTPSPTAAEAVATLLDMGLEPAQLAATLKGSVGQRLVRRLCPHCAQRAALTADEDKFVRAQAGSSAEALIEDGQWMVPAGCAQCRESGYRGRIPLLEIMLLNEGIRKAIVTRAPASELQRLSITHGMVSLASDGIRKAARAETSLAEVIRVLGA